MNKVIVLISIIVSVFLINIGLSVNAQVRGVAKQIEDISIQDKHLSVEILNRQLLVQRTPRPIPKAFSLVINDIRYLEENSGTGMNLMIDKAQDNEDISNHYVYSQYRGIKKLPVLIQVDKFSDETDMGAVLSDIYQLEVETDFKVAEINKMGDVLIVKGDIYGL